RDDRAFPTRRSSDLYHRTKNPRSSTTSGDPVCRLPDQCATAPVRPIPVWLRTVSASKALRSRSARAVLSVIEKNQIAMNASGIRSEEHTSELQSREN